MAGRRARAHAASRTMLPAMASAVTQVKDPARITTPTISAVPSAANPAAYLEYRRAVPRWIPRKPVAGQP